MNWTCLEASRPSPSKLFCREIPSQSLRRSPSLTLMSSPTCANQLATPLHSVGGAQSLHDEMCGHAVSIPSKRMHSKYNKDEQA